jgi:hypothetical protein
MGEDHNVVFARLAFFRREAPAQKDRVARHSKKAGRDYRCTDAEGESEDRDDRETRRLQQQPEAIAKILKQDSHCSSQFPATGQASLFRL